MSGMTGKLEMVRHRDPSCSSGFSAVLSSRYDALAGGDLPHEVELRCWSCGTVVRLRGCTAADDDPQDGSVGVPAEHRPYLSVSLWNSTADYPASVPPERVGQVVLHVEAWLGRNDSPYEYLAADRDGSVLGVVARYSGADFTTTRWRWSALGTLASGEGFHTRDAAARALARAVLPAVHRSTADGAS